MKKIFLALFFVCTFNPNHAKLKVVSTFSILGDMVQNIGGDLIENRSLVGPNMDVHGYQPTPKDGALLKNADLVFINGFALEGWLDQFIKASGFKGQKCVATTGIAPLHEGKAADPHAWHNFNNAKMYVQNIKEAFQKADAPHKDVYEANAVRFLKEITETQTWAHDLLFKQIPCEKRIVITVHDAFQYLGKEFNLTLLAPLGINPDAQPAPKDLAKLLGQIKKYNVKSIFLEPVINSNIVASLAKDAHIRVGDILYSDALSKPEGGADTYLKMMRHNLSRIAKSMCD